MVTVRIRKHIDSESISLPELRQFIGKDVEITIHPTALTEEEWQKMRNRLRDAIIREDDDPFGPAVPPEDWEAND